MTPNEYPDLEYRVVLDDPRGVKDCELDQKGIILKYMVGTMTNSSQGHHNSEYYSSVLP